MPLSEHLEDRKTKKNLPPVVLDCQFFQYNRTGGSHDMVSDDVILKATRQKTKKKKSTIQRYNSEQHFNERNKTLDSL